MLLNIFSCCLLSTSACLNQCNDGRSGLLFPFFLRKQQLVLLLIGSCSKVGCGGMVSHGNASVHQGTNNAVTGTSQDRSIVLGHLHHGFNTVRGSSPPVYNPPNLRWERFVDLCFGHDDRRSGLGPVLLHGLLGSNGIVHATHHMGSRTGLARSRNRPRGYGTAHPSKNNSW